MKKLIFLLLVLLIVGCNSTNKARFKKALQKSTSSFPNTVPITNFRIIDCRGRWEPGGFKAIGEVKNIGNVSAGVQIEAIARDSNGRLVNSQQFWLNNSNNILSDSSTNISRTITNDRSAQKMECNIISTEVW